jgi:hypothetical protein
MEFNVTLRNQEGETTLVEKEPAGVLDILGIELEEIDRETAEELEIDGGLKVTSITSGKLRRHTDMREGFIITRVDGKKPGSVEDFVDYLEKTEGGVMLEGVYEDYPGTYYYAFGL